MASNESVTDKKVVSLEFDNKNFEKNVGQTLNTLDKFKKSLNFQNATDGFDKISSAASKIDMSKLSNACQTCSSKFSALEVVGVGALMRIGEQALHAGENLVKSIAIQPISQGFSEYELKMSSVQTIMNSTGESLETVNGYLDELNEYADKTIYSFSDMTSNIGKFTNAGVSLKDAVAAIQGISNAAALAGADATQASHAMYNFAQALSSGSVRLQDWKSIELANMATQQFKNSLLETAVEMGTVVKVGEQYQSVTTDTNGNVSKLFTTTSQFNESLSAQWMTTEVLTKTLAKYSDETTELGKAAFEAATTVTKYSQLIDTLKESVGSGWARTYEIVFGDYNEAKKLFTGLYERINGFIESISTARNNFLQDVFDKRFVRAFDMQSLKKNLSFREYGNLRGAIYEAAEESGIQLDKLIEKNGGFIESLKDGWLNSELFDKALVKLGYDVENLDGPLGKLSERLKAEQGTVLLRESIFNIIDAIGAVGNAIKKAFTEMFPESFSGTLYNIIKNFHDFTATLVINEETSEKITNTFKGLFSVLRVIQKIVGGALKIALGAAGAALKALFSILKPFANTILTIGSAIGKIISSFIKWAEANNIVKRTIDNIVGAVQDFAKTISNFIKSVLELPSVKSVVSQVSSSIGKSFDNAKETVKDFINSIVNIKDFSLSNIIKIFNDFKNGAQTSILEISQIPGQLADAGTDAVTAKYNELLKMADDSIKKAKDFISHVSEISKDTIEKIKEFAEKAYEVLSKIDWDKVLGFTVQFGILHTVNKISNAFNKVMDNVSEFVKGVKAIQYSIANLISSFKAVPEAIAGFINSWTGFAKSLKNNQNSKALLNLAASIAILVGCMYAIRELKDEDLKRAGIVLISVAVALIAISAALGKMPDAGKTSLQIIALSAALILLTNALNSLGTLDLETTGNGFLRLIFIVGIIIGALYLINKHASDFAKGGESLKSLSLFVVALAAAIKIIVSAIEDLSKIDSDNAIYQLTMLGAVVLAMKSLMGKASKVSVKSQSVIGILGVVIAMKLVISSIDDIANLNMDKILANIGNFIIVIVMVQSLLLSTRLAGKNAAGAGIGLMGIATAMFIMSAAIKALANISITELGNAAIAISMLTIVFAAIMALTRLAGNNALGASLTIMAMATALTLLSVCIGILSLLPNPSKLVNATGCIAWLMAMMAVLIAATGSMGQAKGTIMMLTLCIVALVGAVALLSTLDTNAVFVASASISLLIAAMAGLAAAVGTVKKGGPAAVAIVGMIAIVAELAGVFYLLQNMDPYTALAIAGALLMVILALGGVMVAIGEMKKMKFTEMLSVVTNMGVLVGAVGLVLFALQNVDPLGSIGNATALTILIAALTVSMNYLAKLKDIDFDDALTCVITMGLIAAELGGVLYLVKDINPEQALPTVEALSILILTLTAAVAVINKVKIDFKATLAALESMGAIVLAFSAVVAAFGAIHEMFGGAAGEFIDSGIELFSKVAAGFGKVIGGFFGGIGAGVAEQLESIGTSISNFATNVSISETTMNGVKHMAEALVDFSKVKFSNKFFGSDYSSIKTALEEISPAIKTFAESMAGVETTDIDKAGTAAKAIGDFVNNLPRSGGTLQTWIGSKDLGKFATELAAFAPSFALYAADMGVLKDIKGDIFDVVDESAAAAKTIATFANELPSSGGKLQTWIGEQNMETFGKQLVKFGESFVDYANAISGTGEDGGGEIDTKLVKRSANAAKALAELANNLPNQGGGLSWLFGEKQTLEDFGANIKKLGEGLKDYYTNIKAISMDPFDRSITALEKIFGIAKQFTGKDSNVLNNLNTFRTSMENIGLALVAFDEKIDGLGENGAGDISTFMDEISGIFTKFNEVKIDTEKYNTLSTTLTTFVTSIESIMDMSVQIISKKDDVSGTLETFKTAMTNIGTGLSEFCTKIGEINMESITGIMTDIKTIFDDFSGYKRSDISNFTDIGTALESMTTSISTMSTNIAGVDLSSATSSMSTAISNLFTTFSTTTSSELDKVKKSFDDFLNGIPQTVTDKSESFLSAGSTIVDNIGAGIKGNEGEGGEGGLSAMFSETFQASAQTAIGVIDGMTDQFSGVGAAMALEVNTGAKTEMDNFDDQFSDGINAGLEYLTGRYDEFKTSGTDLAKNVIDGIESKKEEPKNKFQDMVTSIHNYFYSEETVASMNGIGLFLVQGLADGISNNAQLALDEAESLANQIESTIKSALQENSPSKVAFGIGRFFDMGLANGITDNTESVYDASYGLGDNARSGALKALRNIATAIDSDLDFQPQITPVLDLSEIQNGVNTIDSMMSDSLYSVTGSMNVANAVSRSLDRSPVFTTSDQNGNTTNNDNITMNFYITGNTDPVEIANEVSRRVQKEIERRRSAWE